MTGETETPLEELARSVGRAARSSIGTYGFAQGGLLFESGKLPSESISRLEDRIELPTEWRILLICPKQATGLSGHEEAQAFERLPPVSESITAKLTNEVQSSMLPAARAGRLPEFGESVYRYGVCAGECFAAQQGGPFANKLLESWVVAIRRRGFSGVGQSSWGPSLFVLLANENSATECMHWFRRDVLSSDLDATLIIAAISNRGATIA
jgi:beta-RFAP synthase